jgi:hypothetical protein
MADMVVNIEEGRPKVDAAMHKLKLELSTLRRIGVQTVKIIHGYGSSGIGGAIRQATRQYLCKQMKHNGIKAFCPGETFGPFEQAGREMIELAPSLRKDSDWGRQNDGITVVILQ